MALLEGVHRFRCLLVFASEQQVHNGIKSVNTLQFVGMCVHFHRAAEADEGAQEFEVLEHLCQLELLLRLRHARVPLQAVELREELVHARRVLLDQGESFVVALVRPFGPVEGAL